MRDRPRAARTDPAKERRQRTFVIVLAVVVLGGTCAGFVTVAAGLWVLTERVKEANRAAAAVDRATAGREGAAWTLNELYSYLEAKGAVAAMQVVDRGDDDRPGEWVFKTADGRAVRVRRLGDAAAATRDARGRGFTWGRFSFASDPATGERIRQWLHD